MTSRERMQVAMHPGSDRVADRVPVMCQLALGHYFLHAGLPAAEIWHDSHAFADALVSLQERYRFDGILVNLPGRNPAWRDEAIATEPRKRATVIRWSTGRYTVVPDDDLPHVCLEDTERPFSIAFADVDPEKLFYVEPYAHEGLQYGGPAEFPPWQWDTIKAVRRRAPDVSVHGEVFSPFSQLMELLGCTAGMIALVDDPWKVAACLQRLEAGTFALARGHFEAGADAVLISSAYAGGGFISPRHYERFVLPYEHALVDSLNKEFPGRPVYTHTCGAIGDRLELMVRSGTNGIDTLDPPPLGTVDLADAKARLGTRVFIKGNMDPVNTVLRGTPEDCYRDARERIAIASPGGGYILSTACSVPPHAPPENVLQLARAADDAAASGS
ncbi:MAG TPA: uroporphyrinogen decarboxylase family protein [Vicinamibacterales bacterium]